VPSRREKAIVSESLTSVNHLMTTTVVSEALIGNVCMYLWLGLDLGLSLESVGYG